jgi:hypothetical protein
MVTSLMAGEWVLEGVLPVLAVRVDVVEMVELLLGAGDLGTAGAVGGGREENDSDRGLLCPLNYREVFYHHR